MRRLRRRPEDYIWLVAALFLMAAVCYFIWWVVLGFSTCAPGDLPWEDVFPWPLSAWAYAVADFVEQYVVPIVC
jgi:hypothetical protein